MSIDGREVPAGGVRVLRAGPEDTVVRVTLPNDLATGEQKKLTVAPAGVVIPATADLTIRDVKIIGTQPSPISAEAEKTFVINGSGFGSSPGTVKIDDQLLNITNWSEEQIVVKSPSVLQAGNARVEVTRSDAAAFGSYVATVG